MPDCVFCMIRDGKIPCAKVYDDQRTLAFMDINPLSRGHCLVVPKAHAATLYEAYKARHDLHTLGVPAIAIGMLVSFFVAWGVIAAFLAYLKRRGLLPFGVYRLILAALVLWLVH